MGSICGRQDPGGLHVGPVNFAIWNLFFTALHSYNIHCPQFLVWLILTWLRWFYWGFFNWRLPETPRIWTSKLSYLKGRLLYCKLGKMIVDLFTVIIPVAYKIHRFILYHSIRNSVISHLPHEWSKTFFFFFLSAFISPFIWSCHNTIHTLHTDIDVAVNNGI